VNDLPEFTGKFQNCVNPYFFNALKTFCGSLEFQNFSLSFVKTYIPKLLEMSIEPTIIGADTINVVKSCEI